MGLVIFGLIILLIGIVGSKSGGKLAKYKGLVVAGGIVVMIIGGLTATIRQIPAGHIGVQRLFGKVQLDGVLNEGINFVNPLVDIIEMSVRKIEYTMSGVSDEGGRRGDDAIRVLSKENLEVYIDMTLRYRVDPKAAPRIYQTIGEAFEQNFIRPITITRIRENAANFEAVELSGAAAFKAAITKDVEKELIKEGFILEQLMIKKINLPKNVKEKIEQKINAEQEAQQMVYVLQKENQEAEVQRVKARGIRDAQQIMSEGLNSKVLKYEQIKVQKELVNSPNSKIILLGDGQKSPPFIIGN
ncbi:MAG: prohibitin family protein [Candidatus Kapabacteria bacterium]|jgi:regulator of protease activity HflC (stomatin/prohibitin superfamily)|nr:prohibitin family protein [Candidatus Kapabacteria bacterium]